MADQDCYIFEDEEVPVRIRTMSFICRECKEEHYPDTEMHFHQGSTEGYGPFVYECCKCGCVLHEEPEEEEEVETPD
jgi:hypothetical protein